MLVLEVKKKDIIRQLMEYAQSLGRRVTRPVGIHIANLYGTINNKTADDARFFVCDEKELCHLLPEYIEALANKNNLAVCVYLGQKVSYTCKTLAETMLSDASELYVFPTKVDDDKLRICVMFFNPGIVSTSGIDDSATELLWYY